MTNGLTVFRRIFVRSNALFWILSRPTCLGIASPAARDVATLEPGWEM